MQKVRYNTRQREELLAYLKGLSGEHITVNDICSHFAEIGSGVGMTTIYRQLDKMVDEGIVKKYVVDSSMAACFEYVDRDAECAKSSCTHLKCTGCGRLIHLHCDELDAIQRHILEEHSFKVDMTRTVIYGLCEECKAKE